MLTAIEAFLKSNYVPLALWTNNFILLAAKLKLLNVGEVKAN